LVSAILTGVRKKIQYPIAPAPPKLWPAARSGPEKTRAELEKSIYPASVRLGTARRLCLTGLSPVDLRENISEIPMRQKEKETVGFIRRIILSQDGVYAIHIDPP